MLSYPLGWLDRFTVVFSLTQILDVARKRLGAVIQERSRVMDLICNSLTPMSAQEQRRANKDMIRSSTDLTARLVCVCVIR